MAKRRQEISKQKRVLPQHLHQKQGENPLQAPVQTSGAPQTRRTFLGQLASTAAALAVADGVRGSRTAQAGPGAAPKPPRTLINSLEPCSATLACFLGNTEVSTPSTG